MKEKGVKERKREKEKESDEKGRWDGGRAERTGKSFRQRCWMHGRRENEPHGRQERTTGYRRSYPRFARSHGKNRCKNNDSASRGGKSDEDRLDCNDRCTETSPVARQREKFEGMRM